MSEMQSTSASNNSGNDNQAKLTSHIIMNCTQIVKLFLTMIYAVCKFVIDNNLSLEDLESSMVSLMPKAFEKALKKENKLIALKPVKEKKPRKTKATASAVTEAEAPVAEPEPAAEPAEEEEEEVAVPVVIDTKAKRGAKKAKEEPKAVAAAVESTPVMEPPATEKVSKPAAKEPKAKKSKEEPKAEETSAAKETKAKAAKEPKAKAAKTKKIGGELYEIVEIEGAEYYVQNGEAFKLENKELVPCYAFENGVWVEVEAEE